MEKLPQDVKFDIFSRLPSESILEYKLVCKSWLSLFNDPSFAQIHLRRQLCLLNNDDKPERGGGIEFGFIFLAHVKYSDDLTLLYGKYDEYDEQSYMIVKKINYPAFAVSCTTDISSFTMVGSCNGLLCLAIPSRGAVIGDDPTYIINPITREYVNLPRLLDDDDDDDDTSFSREIVCGFGYHPSTNEYKVVRILYSDDNKKMLGQVQVYTLGAGSGWRDKGEVALEFWFLSGLTGTHSNGKLHWLHGDGEIVAFDLADEEFHFFPAPRIVYLNGDEFKNYPIQLCVLGGWLSFPHYVTVKGKISHVDLWLLKNKSNTGYYMNEHEHDCWGWSKEFTIPIKLGDDDDDITLLALTKRGEVLFYLDIEKSLGRYDPKSARIENLIEFDNDYVCTFATPHINSFVSLKALGENSNRIM